MDFGQKNKPGRISPPGIVYPIICFSRISFMASCIFVSETTFTG